MKKMIRALLFSLVIAPIIGTPLLAVEKISKPEIQSALKLYAESRKSGRKTEARRTDLERILEVLKKGPSARDIELLSTRDAVNTLLVSLGTSSVLSVMEPEILDSIQSLIARDLTPEILSLNLNISFPDRTGDLEILESSLKRIAHWEEKGYPENQKASRNQYIKAVANALPKHKQEEFHPTKVLRIILRISGFFSEKIELDASLQTKIAAAMGTSGFPAVSLAEDVLENLDLYFLSIAQQEKGIEQLISRYFSEKAELEFRDPPAMAVKSAVAHAIILSMKRRQLIYQKDISQHLAAFDKLMKSQHPFVRELTTASFIGFKGLNTDIRHPAAHQLAEQYFQNEKTKQTSFLLAGALLTSLSQHPSRLVGPKGAQVAPTATPEIEKWLKRSNEVLMDAESSLKSKIIAARTIGLIVFRFGDVASEQALSTAIRSAIPLTSSTSMDDKENAKKLILNSCWALSEFTHLSLEARKQLVEFLTKEMKSLSQENQYVLNPMLEAIHSSKRLPLDTQLFDGFIGLAKSLDEQMVKPNLSEDSSILLKQFADEFLFYIHTLKGVLKAKNTLKDSLPSPAPDYVKSLTTQLITEPVDNFSTRMLLLIGMEFFSGTESSAEKLKIVEGIKEGPGDSSDLRVTYFNHALNWAKKNLAATKLETASSPKGRSEKTAAKGASLELWQDFTLGLPKKLGAIGVVPPSPLKEELNNLGELRIESVLNAASEADLMRIINAAKTLATRQPQRELTLPLAILEILEGYTNRRAITSANKERVFLVERTLLLVIFKELLANDFQKPFQNTYFTSVLSKAFPRTSSSRLTDATLHSWGVKRGMLWFRKVALDHAKSPTVQTILPILIGWTISRVEGSAKKISRNSFEVQDILGFLRDPAKVLRASRRFSHVKDYGSFYQTLKFNIEKVFKGEGSLSRRGGHVLNLKAGESLSLHNEKNTIWTETLLKEVREFTEKESTFFNQPAAEIINSVRGKTKELVAPKGAGKDESNAKINNPKDGVKKGDENKKKQAAVRPRKVSGKFSFVEHFLNSDNSVSDREVAARWALMMNEEDLSADISRIPALMDRLMEKTTADSGTALERQLAGRLVVQFDASLVPGGTRAKFILAVVKSSVDKSSGIQAIAPQLRKWASKNLTGEEMRELLLTDELKAYSRDFDLEKVRKLLQTLKEKNTSDSERILYLRYLIEIMKNPDAVIEKNGELAIELINFATEASEEAGEFGKIVASELLPLVTGQKDYSSVVSSSHRLCARALSKEK